MFEHIYFPLKFLLHTKRINYANNDFLEKIIPYKKNYAHHKTWHDYNGAGHLRSFLLKTSQTFPFHKGKLILGTWQNVCFLENDEKGRHRTIYCQIIGE